MEMTALPVRSSNEIFGVLVWLYASGTSAHAHKTKNNTKAWSAFFILFPIRLIPNSSLFGRRATSRRAARSRFRLTQPGTDTRVPDSDATNRKRPAPWQCGWSRLRPRLSKYAQAPTRGLRHADGSTAGRGADASRSSR